ncbi:MAG TPA: helix-turn-helix domain-containing protein [Thermoleophilaceae bacterium]
MSTLQQEPWRELSPTVAALIEPELPALRDEILAVIAEQVPEYARPLEGNFGRGLRLGVDEALGQFARLVADPDAGRGQSSEVYRGLGRGEMREGRALDSLQAAYRVGARVAWRRLSEVGLAAGLSPQELCSLADAIFAYIDELAADSVEGYAQAQQAAAGERERRRRRVLTALLAEPVDADELRVAVAEADWELPAEVALLACEPEDLDKVTRRLPVDALAGTFDELGCIVIRDPDGPGRRAELERACAERAAALGPAGPLERARWSWERARSAHAAIRAGALAPELCIVDEHLTEIAFFEAREPLRELRARCLAPLAELTPATRERMTETLKAYLDHRGNAPAMAEALHVHPQTVRYRLKKLRDLFGDALDDPEARFELETAVRVS